VFVCAFVRACAWHDCVCMRVLPCVRACMCFCVGGCCVPTGPHKLEQHALPALPPTCACACACVRARVRGSPGTCRALKTPHRHPHLTRAHTSANVQHRSRHAPPCSTHARTHSRACTAATEQNYLRSVEQLRSPPPSHTQNDAQVTHAHDPLRLRGRKQRRPACPPT